MFIVLLRGDEEAVAGGGVPVLVGAGSFSPGWMGPAPEASHVIPAPARRSRAPSTKASSYGDRPSIVRQCRSPGFHGLSLKPWGGGRGAGGLCSEANRGICHGVGLGRAVQPRDLGSPVRCSRGGCRVQLRPWGSLVADLILSPLTNHGYLPAASPIPVFGSLLSTNTAWDILAVLDR